MDEDDKMEGAVPVEENIPVDPFLLLRQKVFDWECGLYPDRDGIKKEILATIEANSMAPYYEMLCEKLQWERNESLLASMKTRNAEALKALEAKKVDAEENAGETEVHDCMLEMVNLLYKIGDKKQCLEKSTDVYALVKGTSKRLELLFQRIRLGLVFNDLALVKESLGKAQEVLRHEGDWERRNRLKVYEGLHHIIRRDFGRAAAQLLESVATFSSYEVMEFRQFIWYTVLVSLPSLSRPDLKAKVVENSEILSVMPEMKDLNEFLMSIYHCQYGRFFRALTTITEQVRRNVWMAQHVNYFYRELRVLAFRQFLASYRSVTLTKMAEAFALPVTLLDSQLCCFIASNRLTCKIDKVSGQVITTRVDSKNSNYQQLLKNGDLLLNKIQKLARVVGT